jgi:hypothetical protein
MLISTSPRALVWTRDASCHCLPRAFAARSLSSTTHVALFRSTTSAQNRLDAFLAEQGRWSSSCAQVRPQAKYGTRQATVDSLDAWHFRRSFGSRELPRALYQLHITETKCSRSIDHLPLSPPQMEQPAAADALGALLEESTPQTTAISSPSLGEEQEPIPTLASLLLSTAQSLAARSTTTSTTTKLTSKAAPSFALPSSPSTLLSTTASTEYLSSLLALPLSTLLALPTSLSTLSTSLDTDLSSLAFTRYSSFLLSHAATQSISTSFTTLSDSLSALLDSTSALENAAGAFETRVLEVRRKRERMARVRERMEEVEELLEAPSVVDACVRTGYWAEAIDVAVRLSELHARLSSSALGGEEGEGVGALLLLDRVRNEVALALLSLRARVLESLLQRGLKLPGAVRGVGILRRVGERGLEDGEGRKEMDEDALRIVFLAARWRCLRGELESVEGQMAASGIKLTGDAEGANTEAEDAVISAEENEERTRWTKRWIEVWREVVGETVGMYSEVFLSSASTPTVADAPHALPATAPLTLFLATSLESLSTTLAQAIPSLTSPSSLSSLLTQLSYCSHSFARHGLEFRELQQLRERVEARVGRIVVAEWGAAGRKWEKEWRDGWEGNASSSNNRRAGLLGGRAPVSGWLVSPEGLSQVFSTPLPPPATATSIPSTWHHQPQQPLALLPPLARFLNAHAMALNALRLLPPLALYPSLRIAQARELDRATQVLAAFTDAWLASTSSSIVDSQPADELSHEEKLVKQLREDQKRLIIFAIACFGRWVVPWCEGGLRVGVYGELSGKTGVEGREDGVVDAIKRVEGLIARIEGKTVEVEDEVEQSNTVVEEMPVLSSTPLAGVNPSIIEPTLEEPPVAAEEEWSVDVSQLPMEIEPALEAAVASEDAAPVEEPSIEKPPVQGSSRTELATLEESSNPPAMEEPAVSEERVTDETTSAPDGDGVDGLEEETEGAGVGDVEGVQMGTEAK